ncbi:Ribonucleotide reductase of class III (anaerobic), activating protein [uncultured Candidatus Thioglobus sp.]|nr:Ribonucleotide reductase of class III (anaerobic), activating protein [uncultured Candidatus Thioglobus sp.]
MACEGCWNKHTWSFDKKNLFLVDELFDEISNTSGIDGVTFTGGEPFIQAKNLMQLAYRIKSELNLTLQIFTGFELKELNKRYQKELLLLADIVVAGRFDSSKPNNNQRVYQFANEKWQFNNTDVEVEIDGRGEVILTGYPTDKLIDNIREAIK